MDTGDKTHADIDKEAVNRYHRLFKERVEREAKLARHWEWRGNKLPPFSIEHMPHERQRLAGMTTEDRALRRQFLADQQLSPNEPRYIAELYPQNPIRRMLAAPWNALFKALKPILGERAAMHVRYYAPRLTVAYVLLLGAYYNVTYCPNRWTTKSGWHVFESKPIILPGNEQWPEPPMKEDTDFYDRGFKERKSLLELKTSTTAN